MVLGPGDEPPVSILSCVNNIMCCVNNINIKGATKRDQRGVAVVPRRRNDLKKQEPWKPSKARIRLVHPTPKM